VYNVNWPALPNAICVYMATFANDCSWQLILHSFGSNYFKKSMSTDNRSRGHLAPQ